MIKIKVWVNFPWSDEPVECEFCTNVIDAKELEIMAHDKAIKMIFDQGISWDWKVMEVSFNENE